MPAPPYSSSTVMPSRPRSPELRATDPSGTSLSRSMSAARGAISSAAKPRPVAQHVGGLAEVEIQAGKAVRQGRHRVYTYSSDACISDVII